ncbi:MAG: hypothetical protein BWY04_00331 [candidate division CPR1 bacterium ADurb.Bin160]|uniref:Uncharacterized protein n=1 Tax=candidate division CPR1 bacterium ADurb.Bin160 TaxID=1852826 RepID=A0A1V5ZQ13_9BACT|nr:MAG: hypothetical protein BWY04_00331 [candidate division CPR1 bacterium ADurb.Bin160]
MFAVFISNFALNHHLNHDPMVGKFFTILRSDINIKSILNFCLFSSINFIIHGEPISSSHSKINVILYHNLFSFISFIMLNMCTNVCHLLSTTPLQITLSFPI